MSTTVPPYRVKVKTQSGWQDLALTGPQGPPGPPGPGRFVAEYMWDDGVEPPTGAEVRIDTSATPETATKMWIKDVSSEGSNCRNVLLVSDVGSHVIVQDKDDATRIYRFTVAGPAVGKSGYVEIPIAFESKGPNPLVEQRVLLAISIPSTGAPSGPAGGVLSGNYPNPDFAVDMATQAELNAAIASIPAVDITGKVDKDSVVAAATRIVQSRLTTGDGQPSFRIAGDGKIEWGAGGPSAALDTNLYRDRQGFLKTIGSFISEGDRFVHGFYGYHTGEGQPRVWLTTGGRLWLGDGSTTVDTNLYRLGVNALKTDGSFTAFGNITSGVGKVWEIQTSAVPPAKVTFAGDTSIYRSAAGILRTDGTLDANALTINGVPVGTGGGATGPAGGDLSGTYPNPTVVKAALDFGATRYVHAQIGTANQVTLGHNGTAPSPGMYFGNGADTNLYRSAANELTTDDFLYAKLGLGSQGGNLYLLSDGPGGKIFFGAASDTNLYRSAASILKTDGRLHAQSFTASPGTANEIAVWSDGHIYFGSASDTNLYRSGAGTLKTDGHINAGGSIVAKTGLATQVIIGDLGDGLPALAFRPGADPSFRSPGAGDLAFYGNKLYFGGLVDTNLYRSAAGRLRTDGALEAASLKVQPGAGASQLEIFTDGAIYFGVSGNEAKLYKSAAGALKTDGHLYVGKSLRMDLGNAQDALAFGSAFDTILYRAAAGSLRTDGAFKCSELYTQPGAADQILITSSGGAKIFFGSALDTNLYRSGANALKTDGTFDAAYLSSAGQLGVNGAGPAANDTGVVVNGNGIGLRRLVLGGPDSAGSGFRSVRVAN